MHEQPNPDATPINIEPERLLAFVDSLTTAKTLTEINVAAGIFGNELRGISED